MEQIDRNNRKSEKQRMRVNDTKKIEDETGRGNHLRGHPFGIAISSLRFN